jgi:hypothetical protein
MLIAEAEMRNRQKSKPHCSFCGRSSEQAGCLVEGPHVYICDECIGASMILLPAGSRLKAIGAMMSPWRWRYQRVKPLVRSAKS